MQQLYLKNRGQIFREQCEKIGQVVTSNVD